MIPKIIHYCWFGGNPLPEQAIKCIESWKKHLPDYKIKEWNESNFDLNSCAYVKEAYEKKKWAFVTDYVRLYAMVSEGGIYMDTDVEVLSSLDPFLNNHAFSGFENETLIPTGIMASEKNFPLFKEMLDDYNNRHFIKEDGGLDQTTNVITITNTCKKYGFVGNNTKQDINGFVLYPKDYFCPKSYDTGKINLTRNTVTIHHFSGTWHNKNVNRAEKIKSLGSDKNPIIKTLTKIASWPFKYAGRIQDNGFKPATVYYLKKLVGKGDKS